MKNSSKKSKDVSLFQLARVLRLLSPQAKRSDVPNCHDSMLLIGKVRSIHTANMVNISKHFSLVVVVFELFVENLT